MERLPNQVSGRGYYVKAYLNPLALFKLQDLTTRKRRLYGPTIERAAEQIMWSWLEVQPGFGGNGKPIQEAAQEEGYMPVEWSKVEKKGITDLDPSQPLQLEFYGLPAYILDSFCSRTGKSREEAVREGLHEELPRRSSL